MAQFLFLLEVFVIVSDVFETAAADLDACPNIWRMWVTGYRDETLVLFETQPIGSFASIRCPDSTFKVDSCKNKETIQKTERIYNDRNNVYLFSIKECVGNIGLLCQQCYESKRLSVVVRVTRTFGVFFISSWNNFNFSF